jgi:hypothetical protein
MGGALTTEQITEGREKLIETLKTKATDILTRQVSSKSMGIPLDNSERDWLLAAILGRNWVVASSNYHFIPVFEVWITHNIIFWPR